MLNNSNRSLYIRSKNDRDYLDNFIYFLADYDINFLYIDFIKSKSISTSKMNYKYSDIDSLLTIINENKRNLDHIIINLPLIYRLNFIQEVSDIIIDIKTNISIISNNHNSDFFTKTIPFDSLFVVEANLITNMMTDSTYTINGFKIAYNRDKLIDDILS